MIYNTTGVGNELNEEKKLYLYLYLQYLYLYVYIDLRILSNFISKLVKQPKQITKGRGLGLGVGGVILGGLGTYAWTVASADIMFVWYALDNILDGNTFLIPKIEKAVSEGVMNDIDADELMETADFANELAMKQANRTANKNPVAFPASKLILAGADLKNQTYEMQKATYLEKRANQDPKRFRSYWDSNVQTQAPDPIDALRGNQ